MNLCVVIGTEIDEIAEAVVAAIFSVLDVVAIHGLGPVAAVDRTASALVFPDGVFELVSYGTEFSFSRFRCSVLELSFEPPPYDEEGYDASQPRNLEEEEHPQENAEESEPVHVHLLSEEVYKPFGCIQEKTMEPWRRFPGFARSPSSKCRSPQPYAPQRCGGVAVPTKPQS